MFIAPEISMVMFITDKKSCLFIENSINSILDQTYLEFELILVDYISDKNIKQTCITLANRDARIKYKEVQLSKFFDWTTLCNGKYITFMFPQNILSTYSLNILYHSMTNNYTEKKVLFGSMKYNAKKENVQKSFNFTNMPSDIFLNEHDDILYCNSCIIFDHFLLSFFSKFKPKKISCNQYLGNIWKEISKQFKITKIDKILGEFYHFPLTRKSSLKKKIEFEFFKLRTFQMNLFSDNGIKHTYYEYFKNSYPTIDWILTPCENLLIFISKRSIKLTKRLLGETLYLKIRSLIK